MVKFVTSPSLREVSMNGEVANFAGQDTTSWLKISGHAMAWPYNTHLGTVGPRHGVALNR